MSDLNADLQRLLTEYMDCNQAIAYAKIDAQSHNAAEQETTNRNRKANEICFFLLTHRAALHVLAPGAVILAHTLSDPTLTELPHIPLSNRDNPDQSGGEL